MLKEQLAASILEKLNPEQIKAMVRDLLLQDPTLTNAIIARYAYFYDIEDHTEKYDDIFRVIRETYEKFGFIDYQSAGEFGAQVNRMIDASFDLMSMGQLKEASSLLKSILSNWTETMERIDHNSDVSYSVLSKLAKGFLELYNSGEKEIFDFLLSELKKEKYKDISIYGTFEKIIAEMALLEKSPQMAHRALEFLDNFATDEAAKLRLLMEFFPQEYESYVHEHCSTREVADFHISKLMEQGEYEKALKYIDYILSTDKVDYTNHLLELKASIYEKIGDREKAAETIYNLFRKTRCVEYLKKLRELVPHEEWPKIKSEAKRILAEDTEPFSLLEFLIDEGEFGEFIKEVNRLKEKIKQYEYLHSYLLGCLDRLPDNLGSELADILMEASPHVLKDLNTRREYRIFLKRLDPLWKFMEAEKMQEFILGLVKTYPRRTALKDEAYKYLKSKTNNS